MVPIEYDVFGLDKVLSEGMSCYRGVKLSLFDRAPGKKRLAVPALQRLYLGKYAIYALLILVAVRFCQPSFAFQPARGITLTVAGFGYRAAEKLSTEGLSEFIRNTGIQVQFLPSWGNSADQLSLILKTLGSHFSTPDVYLIDVIWPGTLHQHLLDLGPYLVSNGPATPARGLGDFQTVLTQHRLAAGLANDPGRYLPELLKNDTVGGRIVSLPFYVNAGMLFYRTDLLRKYGYLRPPSSWDELQKMAARIQRGERAAGHNSFWGYVWQGGAYEGLTCNALEWQASFGGGRILELDGAIHVNNRQAASAFRMAAGWVGSISPPSVVSYTESDSLNVFRSGNAAFMRYWSSGYRANQAAGSQVRGHFNVTQLPAGPGGRAQTVGGFQLAVSRYSAHPAEAAKLVEYLTRNTVQKSRAIQEGYLPAVSPLYSDTDVLEAVPEAKVLKSARRESWVARPSSIAGAKYSTVSRDYYETVHRILIGQESPEKALDELEKRLVALKINARSGDR